MASAIASRKAEAAAAPRPAAAPAPARAKRRRARLAWFIVALNLVALLVLIAGLFYINLRRSGMIDERILSLKTQGAIIAAALAESATTGPEALEVDAGLATPLIRRSPRRPTRACGSSTSAAGSSSTAASSRRRTRS